MTDFGNSWVVTPDECDDLIQEPEDPCEAFPNATRDAGDLCYVLINEDGELVSHILSTMVVKKKHLYVDND